MADIRVNTEERKINPTDKHDVKFKPIPEHVVRNNGIPAMYAYKPPCIICGSSEETDLCNRTFVEKSL